jgi:hypothetical protein
MTTKKHLHRKSSQVFSLCLLHWKKHVNKGVESPIAKRATAQGKRTSAGQNSVEFRPPNALTCPRLPELETSAHNAERPDT